MKKKLLIISIFLIFQGLVIQAQDETQTSPTQVPSTDTVSTQVPSTDTVSTQVPSTDTVSTQVPSTDTARRTVTIEDVFSVDLSLNSLIDSEQIWFAIPPNWTIDDPIFVNLIYTASELLNEGRSSVTIFVNNQGILSFIPEVTGPQEKHEVSFEIPADLVTQGEGFLVEISTYLSVTTDICELTASPSQWLIIDKESSVSLIPDDAPSPPLLDNLSEHLVGTSLFTRDIPLLFLIPEDPSQAVLTIASLVSQRLGYRDDTTWELMVRSVDEVTIEELSSSNVVVIGLFDEQPFIEAITQQVSYPALIDEKFVTDDAMLVPSSDGVLHLVNSPWNPSHNAFLISGNSNEGLLNAGRVFQDTDLYEQLNGAYKFVRVTTLDDESEAVELLPEAEETPSADDAIQPELELTVDGQDPWDNNQITLAQMGIDTTSVVGLGLNSFFWNLQRPPGWQLNNGAEITLNIGTGYLEPGSYISVFVDSIFVETIDTSEDLRLQYTVELPIEAINTLWRQLPGDDAVLRLDVSNMWRFNICEQIPNESIWSVIEDNSTITLPHTYLSLPKIPAFPYPFAQIDNPTTTSIVLSDNPDDYEIELALRLARQIGRASFGEALLEVSQARHFLNLRADTHLVLLGEGTNNLLLNELQELLPEIAILPLYEGLGAEDRLGVIRQAVAPWNDENILMIISGNDEESLSAAVLSLLANERLTDDFRILEDTDSIRILRH